MRPSVAQWRQLVPNGSRSALYTSYGIMGQGVARVTLGDARTWPDDLGQLDCEAHCTTLAAAAGTDGWPSSK